MVRLEQFEGPLDLLLSLIEEEKLDITTVSLAKVTEQYVEALAEVEEANPAELADFLVVAAKLLLIKSRTLIPSLAGEEEIGDLERRLRMLKEYRDAAVRLEALIGKKQFAYVREDLPQLEPIFVPPKRLTPAKLTELFRGVLLSLEPIFALPTEVIRRAISAREKLKEIHARIEREATVHFSRLVQGVGSREELIVTFLALLELVKRRTIAVVQEGRFGEMVIKKL